MTRNVREYTGKTRIAFVSGGGPIEDKLLSFLSLDDGWFYGKGFAPSFDLVVRSLQTAGALSGLGAEAIEVFPGANGTVLISAYCQGLCVDVTISNLQSFGIVVTKNDTEIFENGRVASDSLIDLVKKERWLACNSSDSCTPSISASKKIASNLWLSKTRTILEFPSSSKAA